jgi:hypothetical protein
MAELAEPLEHDETDTETRTGSPVVSDIRTNRDWVLAGVQEVLDGSPQLSYTTEDVYQACDKKLAVLWTTEDGFVVTTGETDPFTGNRTMLVWVAWAFTRGTNLVMQHQDFFIEAARDAGYKKIEVRSAVTELKSYILSLGWKLDTIVYTRDL